MDPFRKEYLSAKRKKRTFSEMIYNENDNALFDSYDKKIKISKKDKLKEIKLVQFFENLIISKDCLDETVSGKMDMFEFNQNNLNSCKQILMDDILIEKADDLEIDTIHLWDENTIKSFLDYEKVS